MLREEEDVFLRTALTVAILRRREEERKDKKLKKSQIKNVFTKGSEDEVKEDCLII